MNERTRQRPGETMMAPTGDLRRDRHPLSEDALQHLYAAGLELQTIRSRTSNSVTIQRLDQLVSEIDAIAREVRDPLFRTSVHDPERDDPSQLRRLIENSTDMLSRHAPDGTYLYVSPACRELLGYEPDELVGRSAYELFHPEDVPDVALSHDGVLTAPELQTVVYRIRRKDGTYAWFETTGHAVRDPDTGIIREIQASSRDVTARKLAEAELRESEERFRLAMENAPIGMALVGLDGTFQAVNRRLCEIVKRPEEELLALTFHDITHPDDLDTDLGYADRLLAGQIDHYTMEKRYLTPDGEVVWVLLSGSLVRGADASPLYFIAQVVDITARKHAVEELHDLNAALQRSNEDLRRFANVTSHELRTPLATVRGFLDVLEDRHGGSVDEAALAVLRRARDVVIRMAESVEGILALAHLDTEPLVTTPLPIREAVNEAVDALSFTLEVVGADLQVGPLPTVMADRAQIRLVFQNLLSNAVKFRDPSRPLVVTITAHRDGEDWCIVVQDNGRGFDPADHERIFQMFTRNRDGHRNDGAGIGLAVCRRIVERHRGTIRASALDPGARFEVTLPGAT